MSAFIMSLKSTHESGGCCRDTVSYGFHAAGRTFGLGVGTMLGVLGYDAGRTFPTQLAYLVPSRRTFGLGVEYDAGRTFGWHDRHHDAPHVGEDLCVLGVVGRRSRRQVHVPAARARHAIDEAELGELRAILLDAALRYARVSP